MASARAVAAGGALVLLAGCSGGSEGSSTDASVCVEALDAADQGFNDFAATIRQVQAALDKAFAGDVTGATADITAIDPPDSTRYKQLEEQCRDAAG